MNLVVGGSNPSRRAMEKLFIVTRSDLPPGARCAQSCHGLRAFVAAHPEVDRMWFESSNNLVVLEATDELALEQLVARATAAGVPMATYREPDLADALTAVALGPPGRKLVSSLPLALRVTLAPALS